MIGVLSKSCPYARVVNFPHHHEDQQPGHSLDAAGWDERYSAEPVWSGNPNHALVAEVGDLEAGSALDIGCGEGADAVWLAQRGWTVTALDISGNAVARTLTHAENAGVAVDGVVGAFGEVPLPGPFGLVSAQYPALPKGDEKLEEVAGLVAPGGTLLFVHHADLDREHALSHGWDPDDYLMPAAVAAFLAAREGWQVVVDEVRERHVEAGQGAGHTADHVVRAHRN